MPVPTPVDETAIDADALPPTPPSSALAAAMAPGRAEAIGSTFRLPIRPNVRFFLAHHPSEWDAEEIKGTVAGVELDGVYWLPGISRRVLEPGAALIRTRTELEPVEKMYEHARDVSQREGWAWLDPLAPIPAECLPPGVPVGGYWREIPCIDPQTRQTGTFNLEVWNLPTETLPGRPQRFAYHRESFNRYRAWLVLRGLVKPPLEYVTTAIADRMRDRVERARTLPLPDNALARKVREAEDRAVVYDEAKLPARTAAAPEKAGK